MPSLSVGGTTIPVAPGSIKRDLLDVVDRRRAFDNTARASATGGAARIWRFSTPPVTRALADSYEAVLGTVAPQLCSGDIIALPTMCIPEILPDWEPVKAQASQYVVLNFALHEVQGKKLLLEYSPGDTITGESFTGPANRTYFTSAGVLAYAAVNVKRDSHYPTIGGTRSLLLEDARTNLLLRSEEFDNAAWAPTNITVTANNTAAPDGNATADKIAATASAATQIIGSATAPSTGSYTYTLYIKQGSGVTDANGFAIRNQTTATNLLIIGVNYSTGAINYVVGTTGATMVAVGTNSWWKLTLTVTSGVTAADTIYCYAGFVGNSETAGEYLFAWGAQLEAAAFASSYIPTVAATVTRTAESYSLPFTTPPQEMTVYAKFVEGGSALTESARIFAISNGAGTPELFQFMSAGSYYLQHYNASTFVSASQVVPALGVTEERMSRLFGDGSVDSTQSTNGAAATVSSQSGPLAFASAWAGPLVWLNSAGASGFAGFTALQSFKIVAGARSLVEMRAA